MEQSGACWVFARQRDAASLSPGRRHRLDSHTAYREHSFWKPNRGPGAPLESWCRRSVDSFSVSQEGTYLSTKHCGPLFQHLVTVRITGSQALFTGGWFPNLFLTHPLMGELRAVWTWVCVCAFRCMYTHMLLQGEAKGRCHTFLSNSPP